MQDETTAATGPGPSEGGTRAKAAKAKEFVGEKYAAASESARKAYGTVREKVSEADFGGTLDDIRNYVRENPGKALLMSVGAGFLLGLLLRRTGDDEE